MFNFTINKSKAIIRQMDDARIAMIDSFEKHPNRTCIVYMGGLKENSSMRRETTMHTICFQGLNIDESIEEAAKKIVKNGSTFNGRILYMANADSVQDITGRVWDKINSMGLGEIRNKIDRCREDMAITSRNACAILYVDGVRRSETNVLNQVIYHTRMNKNSLILMAVNVVRRYNYTGKVYILYGNNVEDVTVDVAYLAKK